MQPNKFKVNKYLKIRKIIPSGQSSLPMATTGRGRAVPEERWPPKAVCSALRAAEEPSPYSRRGVCGGHHRAHRSTPVPPICASLKSGEKLLQSPSEGSCAEEGSPGLALPRHSPSAPSPPHPRPPPPSPSTCFRPSPSAGGQGGSEPQLSGTFTVQGSGTCLFTDTGDREY